MTVPWPRADKTPEPPEETPVQNPDGINLPLDLAQINILLAGGMLTIAVPDSEDPENSPGVIIFVRGPKP